MSARNLVTCLACGISFLPGSNEPLCPCCARPAVSPSMGRAYLSIHPFAVHLLILLSLLCGLAYGLHTVADRVSTEVAAALTCGGVPCQHN